MFKVECPGCKAPYQVDERRVPPSGLKMRCPKCGTSFQVDPPPADPRSTAASSSVLGASLGFSGDSKDESIPPPAIQPRPPLPQRKPALKGTMIGVAPPRAAASPPATAPAIPAAAATPAAARPASPAASASDPFGEIDLPAPVNAPPRAAAKPSPAGGEVDLPSPAARPPPVPRRPGVPTRQQGSPVVQPAAPVAAARPQPAPPAATPAADPFGIELDGGDWGGAVGEADLPMVGGGRADLPVAAAPRGRDAPADLPAPKAAAPARPAAASARPAPARAPAPELDLPVVAGGTDLPSLSGGIDLPSLSGGIDLPSVSAGHAAAPVARAGMPGFGELDLPIAAAELPSPAAGLPSPVTPGLPSPAAGLPVRSQAGLPMQAAGLPMQAAGLPSPVPGEIELSDDGAIPHTDDPFGVPALTPSAAPGSLRPAAADPFGVGMDPFDGAGADPFAASPGDPFARSGDPFGGHLDAPAASDPPAAASLRAPPGSHRPSGDPGRGASDAALQDIVRKGGGGTAYGEVNLDDGGGDGVAIEGDLPQAPVAAVTAAATASAAAASGEVGSEFAGLPEEVSLPGGKRARPDAAQSSVVAEIQAKKKRRRVRVVVAVIAVLVLSGGALTLVPTVGPFGAYFILDQVRRGEYERSLATATETVHRSLGADTAPDADAALRAVESASSGARRYKPLAAYAAFVGFDRTLRFGAEPSVYARAKVTLDEMAEVRGVDKLDLARATKATIDGELALARQLLDQLSQSNPSDADVRVVRGEVELRARDKTAALTAWKAATDVAKSPRTYFGLARATLASGDAPGAQKLAEEVLGMNPRHVGARLLLAEDAWTQKHDEPRATKLLEEVQAGFQGAGPEERIVAQTLLGEIHLSRGRMSQAEQAFEEAIKTAEVLKASALGARALGGLGEALFRANRYSQAIARYKAAAQADPDDVSAQVGVAKSSLMLERVDEARDMLSKLRKTHGTLMQVAYWYGRVQEALGDRKEAEAAYKDAIANGKGDPDAVQAYIALARVQSAGGQLDAARATLADAQARLPASPALHKALGRVAMSQGRYNDGYDSFQKALELDPGDVDAKFLLGTALVRQRQFDKALEIFDAVGKVDRDFPGLALERGILFQESGHTEEALREYESALAKAPNDPDLMLKVGCGKADAGAGVEAEKLLKKVLEQRQTSAETFFCMGRAQMAKHDLSDAIKSFERAIQIDPNHAEYYLYVGWASNEAGALAKASIALKKALELDQGLADAYWQRGVLRVRQTRPKDAIEDLLKALELRPSRYQAHADLALAYYDLGKEDLALGEWQKAIAANPNEATWHFHYGKLLSLRLQNGAAAEQLKKAIELAEADGGNQPWLSEAHRLCALSLGNSPAAIPHWQAFLKNGAMNSPYRNEAKTALRRLGSPWQED